MEDKMKIRAIDEEELDKVTGGVDVSGEKKGEEVYCECEKPIPGFDGYCKKCGKKVNKQILISTTLLQGQQKLI